MSLAYDMAQTRQETAFSDPSDLVARRMGFIPLPLGVAIARVLCSTLTSTLKLANIFLFFLFYLILVSLRILISLMILGRASDLISIHSQSSITNKEENVFSNKAATSESIKTQKISSADQSLVTAIFSNSSVSLNNVCLNDALLKTEKIEKRNDTKFVDKLHFEQADSFLVPAKNVVRAGSEPLLSQD